jgi:hypothetical protein
VDGGDVLVGVVAGPGVLASPAGDAVGVVALGSAALA